MEYADCENVTADIWTQIRIQHPEITLNEFTKPMQEK